MQSVMASRGIDRAAAEKLIVASNPIGRMIAVQEVASAALYLASEGAAMVNGHAMSVSGGEI